MEHFDWWKYSGYDAIFTSLGDDSQGIKTDGKHGGFVDRKRP